MGANSQQGWALLLFLIGFTFLPAGLVALGTFFIIAGLVCLAASVVMFVKIKPLEHYTSPAETARQPESLAMPSAKKRAV